MENKKQLDEKDLEQVSGGVDPMDGAGACEEPYILVRSKRLEEDIWGKDVWEHFHMPDVEDNKK